MPRDDGNEIYNVLDLTVTFNNLFPNIKKITSKSSEEESQNNYFFFLSRPSFKKHASCSFNADL